MHSFDVLRAVLVSPLGVIALPGISVSAAISIEQPLFADGPVGFPVNCSCSICNQAVDHIMIQGRGTTDVLVPATRFRRPTVAIAQVNVAEAPLQHHNS